MNGKEKVQENSLVLKHTTLAVCFIHFLFKIFGDF
jgi:hypothetical protein